MKKLDRIPGDLLDCLKFGKKIPINIPSVIANNVGIKIAHVLPKNSKLKDLVEFTSTVEYNRGGFVQDFDTVKDAINWFHIKENLTKI